MPLTNYSLDNFVAPHLSELTQNNAPELRMDQQDYWVRNFILNTLFGVRLLDPHRQYVYNFLRKVEAAFYEYGNARLLLEEYIIIGRDAVSKYLTAVIHFESCQAQAYQAYMLVKNIIGQNKLFEKNDGSTLDRLNKMYNLSKHVEAKIAKGELPGDSLLPVWITNNGIESSMVALTFNELIDLLKDLGEVAQKLSNSKALEGESNKKVDLGGKIER